MTDTRVVSAWHVEYCEIEEIDEAFEVGRLTKVERAQITAHRAGVESLSTHRRMYLSLLISDRTIRRVVAGELANTYEAAVCEARMSATRQGIGFTAVMKGGRSIIGPVAYFNERRGFAIDGDENAVHRFEDVASSGTYNY